MKRWFNAASQICALAGQMLIPLIPADDAQKNAAHTVLAFIQMAISIIAHNYTPEGDRISKAGE